MLQNGSSATSVGQRDALKEFKTYLCRTVLALYAPALCVRDINIRQAFSLRDVKRKDVINMTKRLVSLLMALMLVVGIFAVPAMAAKDDGIEPCVVVTRCDYCDGPIYEADSGTWAENGYVTLRKGCYKTSDEHEHFRSWKVTGIKCRSCGQWTVINRVLMTDDCTIH